MKTWKYIFNFSLTVISIGGVVFIQEFIPEKRYSLKNILLVIMIIVVCVIAGLREVQNYKDQKRKIEEKTEEEKNKLAKAVLTQTSALMDLKADLYKENTYELTILDKEWPYFYSPHNYLHKICENLKETVAQKIGADSSYVDVSLIYSYEKEKEWKWLAGKSGMSSAIDLERFIEDPDTLYNYILNHKEEIPIFRNDKSKSEIYKWGRRDRLFNGKGSFYAMNITFQNNVEALVEAILLISTYGVNFIPLNSKQEDIDAFGKIMAYEIVPYYISMIQVELGALYMRHVKENVIHIPKRE